MAEQTRGSSVPRRHLGRKLRELRVEARITLEAAAAELDCSAQRLWLIESGRGPVRLPDVRAMCALYEASPELTGALLALAAETKAHGWWHAHHGPVPAWLDLYPGLEATAGRLREHAPAAIPDLLQTEGYAHLTCRWQPRLTADERAGLVGTLLRRQELLLRSHPPAPGFDVILAEEALLRGADHRTVMADQLRHLLEVGRILPHVTVRVLPLAAGPHPGTLAGSFTLLDFPQGSRLHTEPSIVYRELLTGALYLDRESEITAYERVWASLDALALDVEKSRHLVEKITVEVHGG